MENEAATRSGSRITAIEGDITRLSVDAVVNAANESLQGGGGVDGAIHRAAGPELLEHCRSLDGCPTGEARITPGYRMAARHIVHTVGPVWQGGDAGEDALLAACYRNSLDLAAENGARTIAFPAISTGAYGFPRERAADIAVATVTDWLARRDGMDLVVFCCFDASTTALYEARLGPGANKES